MLIRNLEVKMFDLLISISRAGEDPGEIGSQFEKIMNDVMLWAWIIVGATGGIWAIMIGLKFLTAQGDERKLKEAKDALKHFFVGIVVIAIILLLFNPLIRWIQTLR